MDKCIEAGEEFLKALEEAGETEHAEIIKGVMDDMKNDYEEELEEEDNSDEEDGEDEESKVGPIEGEDTGEETGEDELNKFAGEEVEKKTGKPIMVIKIGKK